MNVAVLIPHRAIDDEREANLERTRKQWRRVFYEHVGWPVFACDSHPDSWSRSEAINNAAREAGDTDVYFIADNDILLGGWGQAAAAAAEAFLNDSYVVAFTHLHVLDWDETRRVREGAAPDEQPRLETISRIWGGAFAVSGTLFERVGGFDERFVGYGAQDMAFLTSCSTLGGVKGRVAGHAYHLRHLDPVKDHPHLTANYALGGRYARADGDVEAMQQLLAER
jgi:hypothetical protein